MTQPAHQSHNIIVIKSAQSHLQNTVHHHGISRVSTHCNACIAQGGRTAARFVNRLLVALLRIGQSGFDRKGLGFTLRLLKVQASLNRVLVPCQVTGRRLLRPAEQSVNPSQGPPHANTNGNGLHSLNSSLTARFCGCQACSVFTSKVRSGLTDTLVRQQDTLVTQSHSTGSFALQLCLVTLCSFL